jgi:hypothetical protein
MRELWLPLFTIATQAAGWDTRCWNAAVQLTTACRQEESDDSVLLLADIRTAFGGRNKLFGEELLKLVRNLEDLQYAGRATQSAKALANALAPPPHLPEAATDWPGDQEGVEGVFAGRLRGCLHAITAAVRNNRNMKTIIWT